VLRNLFDSLKPGGACLIDVSGKEQLLRTFQPLRRLCWKTAPG